MSFMPERDPPRALVPPAPLAHVLLGHVWQCSVKKRKDSVLIKLAKKKRDHHWYELFKTKGIGEE